jgi:hypothetical protein
MKISQAPAFLLERCNVPRSTGKTAVKKARAGAPRFEGDTGTREMKKQQKVIMEVRERSSTGHATMLGVRVEAQFPIDRYQGAQGARSPERVAEFDALAGGGKAT